MVVQEQQEESERRTEAAVIREPVLLHPSKYVLVRNHVRELRPGPEGDSDTIGETSSSSEPKRKKKKRDRSKVTSDEMISSPSTSTSTLGEKIKDFEELRDVYFKCKNMLTKIEEKYGDELKLYSDNSSTDSDNMNKLQKRNESNDKSVNNCSCEKNTRIVFDDSGNEISKSPEITEHVCILNPKAAVHVESTTVQIEYDKERPDLPEDIRELTKILQDRKKDIPYRNAVFYKIRMIRQDLLSEIKYHKSSLIEKLKKDPEDMLDFEGTNLCELKGYS